MSYMQRREYRPILSCLLYRSVVYLSMMMIGRYHVKAYIPEVNRRAIAGLWKLTHKVTTQQQTVAAFPVKEFTVFPKDKQQQQQKEKQFETTSSKEQEMLLMLHEDGHFVQYDSNDDADNKEVQIPDKLKYLDDADAVLEKFLGRIKGQWDYVDGKLLLAADRPAVGEKASSDPDTLLIGEVVAKKEESLQDNPLVESSSESSSKKKETAFDTHLSVPKGKIKVGRFTYPKHHPSFFDQPMFTSTTRERFELKQVLGSLNTQSAEEEKELIEKVKAKQFYGKRFLLSSHPLKQRRPKGNVRWSIKYNKYVEDPPSKKAQKKAEEDENRPVNIRVVEVAFFANNTFATVSGLGDNILRGKFHIIGENRDQLWMQVWRFGFGRSVSGSVYSEGKSLTKEDEKTYWGEISYEDEGAENIKDGQEKPQHKEHDPERRLVINGSVIYAMGGIEPQPVGRFIMTETSGDELDEEDEEEDDEDDELDWSNAFQDNEGEDDDIDWSIAFQ